MRLGALFCLIFLLTAQAWAAETWTAYSNTNEVNDLFIHGEEALAGTTGGLIRWDIASGFCSKITSLEGLGGNNVRCVEVAPDGSLWVGTDNGLSIYAGSDWRTFTKADGLGGNQVWDIDFATDGSVWLATIGSSSSKNGPTFFDWETITVYTHEDGLSGRGGSTPIAIAPDGHVWFSASGAVDEFDGTQFIKHEISMGAGWVKDIAFGPDSEVWCITESALYRRDGDAFVEVKRPDNKSIGGPSLALDDAGVLWVGGYEWGYSGLWSFDGEDWHRWGASDGLCNEQINSIVAAEDSALWLGTQGGVSRFDGSQFRTYATEDLLLKNDVSCLTVLADGRLFYGTDEGAGFYAGSQWALIEDEPGPPQGVRVCGIAEDLAGNLWFATDQGARRFDGQQWEVFFSQLPRPRVDCIAADREGSVWFGTSAGLARFDGSNWQSWTLESDDALVDNEIHSLAAAPDGLKWFSVGKAGGKYGLQSFDGYDAWAYYPPEVIGTYIIRSMAFDSEGDLWIPISGGVRRFDGDTWTLFGKDSGFPMESASLIAIGRNDVKWVSVRDADGSAAGVCSFNGVTWKHYTIADGLFSNTIRDIVVGLDDSIWFATDCGISRLQVMTGQSPEIAIATDRDVYQAGDSMTVSLSYENPGPDVHIDIQIACQLPDGSLFYYPGVDMPVPFISGMLSSGTVVPMVLVMSYDFDENFPTGDYIWMTAMFEQGTFNMITDIATAPWRFE